MTIPQVFDLAVQRHLTGRLADAEALYRQILAAQPHHADALHFLGVIADQTGRHELAVDLIRRAIDLNPHHPAAHSNLGEACRNLGQLDEAIAANRRALELKPDFPEAHYNLAVALRDQGQLDEAVASSRRALEFKPNFPEALNNLGIALAAQGQLAEAVLAYRHALEIRPDYPEVHNNLGNALKEMRLLDEAIAAYRRAIELKPDDTLAHNNLAVSQQERGQVEEAIATLHRALELKPDQAWIHSNLIYTLHFHPGQGNRTLAGERQRWNRQFSEPLKQFLQPHANDRNPERPIRVGYVSPLFRDHVVGRNLLPLFERHNRRDFEIFCYSGVVRGDQLTDAFRQRAHRWRSTVGVGDEALADMIRRDGVDILVDLTQHMAENRLPVFARKPAPIQVSFAGYPESTGLDAIEHRISDPYLEAGSAEEEETGTKEQVHLIDSFWCYDPCGIEVEVNSLPALSSRTVTFGCLNNFCKTNEPVLKLWTRVLTKVKDSRLLIWSPAGSHRQRILEVLKRTGVEADRVELVEYRPRREYLQLYHRLDIVLDTFPYNGHTTSLDALWMGVPVVSLVGNTPVSRAGLSQLTNLGLPELAAHSDDTYVNIAERLARDIPRLAELRATLRDRMRASVLMDAPRFARSIEAAYRSMWRAWCRKQSP